jgi:sugar lactone lactonase YvrE
VSLPQGLAAGAAGEVLIAELTPGRILRVSSAGEVTTIAGNGLKLYNGDGAGPLQTQLAEPANVLPGANGALYIASAFADRVLRLDSSGTVGTAVGGGDPTDTAAEDQTAPQKVVLTRPQALLQDVNGDLLFSDYDNGVLRRLAAGGTDTKLEMEIPIGFTSFTAALQQQGTLAGDGTRVFLSSPSDHHVWVIEAGRVKPFAGTGEAGFRGEGGAAREAWLRNPSGLALDKDGNLYIADTRNHRIRKVDAATGSIATVWPQGEVDEASLPTGLALDANGVLYAADAGLHRVWRIEADSGKATVAVGSGEAGFSGDDGPAADARLYRPCGIAFDSEGRLYIADTGNQRIRRVRFGAE